MRNNVSFVIKTRTTFIYSASSLRLFTLGGVVAECLLNRKCFCLTAKQDSQSDKSSPGCCEYQRPGSSSGPELKVTELCEGLHVSCVLALELLREKADNSF